VSWLLRLRIRLMPRRNTLYPRPIAPELIEAGDTIECEFPETAGVTVIKRGIVAYVQAHAGQRHILTQEGTVLSVWQPGKNNRVKYTLINRAEFGTPMLDMFVESGRL
jgi:hypothetical protein